VKVVNREDHVGEGAGYVIGREGVPEPPECLLRELSTGVIGFLTVIWTNPGKKGVYLGQTMVLR